MNNLRGALLMIASMGLFALEDMLIKLVAAVLPIGQVLLILALGGVAVFAVATRARRQALMPRDLLHPMLILRNTSELVGTCCFVLALSLVPISTASAILQATPLAVTMCAAFFLGEQVGWRRWTAIAAGFLGVILIVRPGLAGFQPASLLAVVAVLAFAGRDVATRLTPPQVSTAQVSLWAYVMIIPAGLTLLTLSDGLVAMSPREIWLMLATIAIGVAAYTLIVVALRSSDLSAIAPFRYSRLIFAMIIGLAVFGERPDSFTLAGAALIIASGLYALARERALFSEARQG